MLWELVLEWSFSYRLLIDVGIGFGLMLCKLVFNWFMFLIKNKVSSFLKFVAAHFMNWILLPISQLTLLSFCTRACPELQNPLFQKVTDNLLTWKKSQLIDQGFWVFAFGWEQTLIKWFKNREMEPGEGSLKLEWGIPGVCRLTGIPHSEERRSKPTCLWDHKFLSRCFLNSWNYFIFSYHWRALSSNDVKPMTIMTISIGSINHPTIGMNAINIGNHPSLRDDQRSFFFNSSFSSPLWISSR